MPQEVSRRIISIIPLITAIHFFMMFFPSPFHESPISQQKTFPTQSVSLLIARHVVLLTASLIIFSTRRVQLKRQFLAGLTLTDNKSIEWILSRSLSGENLN